MPLINLRTSLKDLKFTGPAPYVVKDINLPGPPAASQIQARIDDVNRISKMLTDKPGAVFAAKQGLLQASQIQNLTAVNLGNTIIPVAARLQTILSQIPVNGTGTHFSVVEASGAGTTYVGSVVASSEAKYGGKVRTRKSSRFTNPVFKYQQLLVNDNLPNYSTAVGRTAGANLAETNGEIKLTRFTPDIQNRELYKLSKQVGRGNALDFQYGFAGANTRDAVNLLDVGKNGDDLVPLKVNIIGNLNSLVVFRGFYDNISDSYNGAWSDTSYIGRAESLYVYSKFNRTLSFTFKVPIFSPDEQDPVFNKVNSLVSYTAPEYSPAGFAKGTILQLQIGDYIKTNGVLNSVGVTVDNNVPWSVGNTRKLLPQVLNISISFSVIHSAIPEISLGFSKPYIASEQQQIKPTGRIQPRPEPGYQAIAASNARLRQQFELGRELGQAANNLVSGLGSFSLPSLSPRSPRPVIEVGDGVFGPPIFDSQDSTLSPGWRNTGGG